MKFYSLSKFPGKTGERFYNTFFSRLGLDHTYTAIGTTNLLKSVAELVHHDAAGISISMPFKQEIISMLDYKDNSVIDFSSCNTVKIINGKLHGYNTDVAGVLFAISKIPENSKVTILGDGSMGTMFKKVLPESKVCSRKLNNWSERDWETDVIINTTSFGTSTVDAPCSPLSKTTLVIDLAIKENKLQEQCLQASVPYISGLEFYKHQFLRQFEIYTGVVLDIKDLEDL